MTRLIVTLTAYTATLVTEYTLGDEKYRAFAKHTWPFAAQHETGATIGWEYETTDACDQPMWAACGRGGGPGDHAVAQGTLGSGLDLRARGQFATKDKSWLSIGTRAKAASGW